MTNPRTDARSARLRPTDPIPAPRRLYPFAATGERLRLQPSKRVLSLVASANPRHIALLCEAFGPTSAVATIQHPWGRGTSLRLEGLSSSVQGVDFVPGEASLVAVTDDNRVAVYSAATGKVTRSIAMEDSTETSHGMALDSTGSLLAVAATSARSVRIYDFKPK